MDYKQLLEMSLNENIMLKNSLNTYAAQAAACIQKMDGISASLLKLQADNSAFTEQLQRFADKVNRRTLMRRK